MKVTDKRINSIIRESVRKALMEADMNAEWRYLEIDEMEALLHKMIDSDFVIEFENGRTWNCNSITSKGLALSAVCNGRHMPKVAGGKIQLYDKEVGFFQMDNILNDGI